MGGVRVTGDVPWVIGAVVVETWVRFTLEIFNILCFVRLLVRYVRSNVNKWCFVWHNWLKYTAFDSTMYLSFVDILSTIFSLINVYLTADLLYRSCIKQEEHLTDIEILDSCSRKVSHCDIVWLLWRNKNLVWWPCYMVPFCQHIKQTWYCVKTCGRTLARFWKLCYFFLIQFKMINNCVC